MSKIRKPMRLEENLIEKVEKQGKGENFTAKMEFILDDYFNTLDKREAKLKEIEKKIKQKEKEYQDFKTKVEKSKDKFNQCLRDILWS